jgi:hypothetical protein
MVNQTDLASKIGSRNAEGVTAMDFGMDIMDTMNIVDLGITAMEIKITRTRDRPKEE